MANDDDAIELTAVTFEKALRAIHRYQPQSGGFRAWVLRIARNAAVDRYRRARPMAGETGMPDTVASPDPSPEDVAVASDERRRIRALVGALPQLLLDCRELADRATRPPESGQAAAV